MVVLLFAILRKASDARTDLHRDRIFVSQNVATVCGLVSKLAMMRTSCLAMDAPSLAESKSISSVSQQQTVPMFALAVVMGVVRLKYRTKKNVMMETFKMVTAATQHAKLSLDTAAWVEMSAPRMHVIFAGTVFDALLSNVTMGTS